MFSEISDRIKIVACNADEILWIGELELFVQNKQEFCRILSQHYSDEQTMLLLKRVETKNISFYGCGLKIANIKEILNYL